MDISKLQGKLLEELTDVESLLQQELAEEEDKILARENNYRFLRLLIEQPELAPHEYRKSLLNKYGVSADVDVSEQLRANDLYSIGKRSRLSQIMKGIGTKTYNLIMGQSSDSPSDYDDIAKIVLSKFFRERMVEGKLFLISLTLLPAWQEVSNSVLQSLLEKLKGIASKGSYKLCREAARQLVYVLGIEYGLAKRRTGTERVQAVLEDIEISRDVDDLRASLLIVQRELTRLRDEFQDDVKAQNEEFIIGFFSRMNSPRYGHLLDTIAQTNALIEESQNKWSIPSELRVVPTVIQMFMNHLRSEGVQPIELLETLGKPKELPKEKLSMYEFIGSKDLIHQEKVTVIVKTPGWKIGETIISKPLIEAFHPNSRNGD